MLKIPQMAAAARRLEFALLALVIVLPASAASPTVITLHNFTNQGDGGSPQAGLVLSSSGVLYGTTFDGAVGWGTVFQLTPVTGGGWKFSTIYNFTGGADGAEPVAELVIGTNNVLYGTTYLGGASGYGTVFQLAQGTGGAWTETVLYSFKNGNDGAYPASGLVLNSNGVLYGTTYGGGTAGLGTVYEVLPSGSGWSEKVLYSFKGNTPAVFDGAYPIADMVLGSSGSLFGTTSQGGSVTITNQPPCTTTAPCTYLNQGTIFELTPKGGGTWAESVLYTFTGGSDGGAPESGLIVGKNNVLYGSTFWGGSPTNCPVGGYPQGCGVVFQLAPKTGGTWTQSVLHTFSGVSPDGSHPYRNMTLNTSGALFGTTLSGGIISDVCFPDAYPGCGTIFELKPPTVKGGSWTKSNITTFTEINGGGPNGVILNNGTLYGTTIFGGNSTSGTVYSMTP